MTIPLLGLVMIVRDEASNIRSTLASARPHVDWWTVLDTGSVDGTQGAVREEMSGILGRLYEEPFVDFATSRNRVLDLAVGVDLTTHFTLMLSGDEVLEGGEALRSFLEGHRLGVDGAYCVEVQSGNLRWGYPRVLRASAGWRYVGENQEVPVGPGRETSGPTIPGVRIVHRPSDPERRSRRVREVDLPTLEKIVGDASRPLTERAQAMFHLAQTHAVVAAESTSRGEKISHFFAAMGYYLAYAEVAGGGNAETGDVARDDARAAYARFMFFHVAEKAGVYTREEMVRRLAALVSRGPEIPEARYMLAACVAAVDVRRGLDIAIEAAEFARVALAGAPGHVPLDVRVEWLSYRLAAACAQELGDTARSRKLARFGVKAGGPADAFAKYLT